MKIGYGAWLGCLGMALGSASMFGQGTYEFSDGGRRHTYQLSATEHYVVMRQGAAAGAEKRLRSMNGTKGTVKVGQRGWIVEQAGDGKKVRAGLREVSGVEQASPVFYDVEELPEASKLAAMTAANRAKRMAVARRVMTAKLLVKMDTDAQWDALRGQQAREREESALKDWRLVRFDDADAALAAAEWMMKDGKWEFTPVFAQQRQLRQSASGTRRREVNDRLFPFQWHLEDSMPGLNMRASWDVVTGRGINIVVVDNGVEVTHEDLAANTYPRLSGFHRNYLDGDPRDPTPVVTDITHRHGTSCAGLAAATGFNNLGVIGVAPEARIMAVRLIGGMAGADEEAGALSWQPAGVVSHVSSNSWGAADDGIATGRSSAQVEAALSRGANLNRNGLGTVYVVSAGNGRGEGDNSNYDAFAGSRFVIAVGAANRNGEQSSYSENGMNVAISALGGEYQPPGVVWTTTISGPEYGSVELEAFPTTEAPENYTDAFNGTSAAAPQVSGAVALMLQRNPRLGYRDVKEILFRTARRDGLKGGDGFWRNGAGFFFNHAFGAGLLNVSAAVDMAGTWTNLGQLFLWTRSVEGNVAIPDGGAAGAQAELDLSDVESLRVETVEVVVDVTHGNRGDLRLEIESPSGMPGIVEPRPLDDGSDLKSFQFSSVRYWGEQSSGVWKVKVLDTVANGARGSLTGVTLRVYGTRQPRP